MKMELKNHRPFYLTRRTHLGMKIMALNGMPTHGSKAKRPAII